MRACCHSTAPAASCLSEQISASCTGLPLWILSFSSPDTPQRPQTADTAFLLPLPPCSCHLLLRIARCRWALPSCASSSSSKHEGRVQYKTWIQGFQASMNMACPGLPGLPAGEFILRTRPESVVVETAVCREHGAFPGAVLTSNDQVPGSSTGFVNALCQVRIQVGLGQSPSAQSVSCDCSFRSETMPMSLYGRSLSGQVRSTLRYACTQVTCLLLMFVTCSHLGGCVHK